MTCAKLTNCFIINKIFFNFRKRGRTLAWLLTVMVSSTCQLKISWTILKMFKSVISLRKELTMMKTAHNFLGTRQKSMEPGKEVFTFCIFEFFEYVIGCYDLSKKECKTFPCILARRVCLKLIQTSNKNNLWIWKEFFNFNLNPQFLGLTAGGCSNDIESFSTNPQFKIVLEDSDEDDDEFCSCIISLMQKGTRGNQCSRESEGCLAIGLFTFWVLALSVSITWILNACNFSTIKLVQVLLTAFLILGFAVYLISEPNDIELPLTAEYLHFHRICTDSGTFACNRQVSSRLKLEPGTYVIIPSTYSANEEGEFLLRVFAELPATLKCIQE